MRKRIILIVSVTLGMVLLSEIIPLVFIKPKTLYDASFKNWEEYNFNYYVGWGKYNCNIGSCEENGFYREDIIVDLKQEDAKEFFEDVDGIRVARYYGIETTSMESNDIEHCLYINHYNETVKKSGIMWDITFYKQGKTRAWGFFNPYDKHSIFETSIYYSDLMVNDSDYKIFAEKYFKTNDIGGQADE